MHQWRKTDSNHYRQAVCLALVIFFFSIVSPVFASTRGINDVGSSGKTRGIAVLALDSGSGQKKEIRLYNKTYALIIGIDQYVNLPLDRQLTYAVRDAKGVALTLERNFKFNKVITLYNREATRDRILEVLTEQLPREMTREDSLFVFWAGHGNQEKGRYGDLGYLIPYDGSLTKIRKNITMAEIRDTISKKIPAKHIFYVMDACYGGLLAQTRAVDKRTKRDFHYLQEMTSEPAIQVLTAGGKDQEVLDGGPRGHSVFTGRLIEVLENAQDFITANELQAFVKEKVFSDARARNHEQTPSFGELFGTGDYVFVPSIERKVDDTRSKVAVLQKEMERLKMIEAAAAKAKDERARRMAELDKLALQAKLKAEQLKQQALEAEHQKRQLAEKEQKHREAELSRQKRENEKRLAALKQEVAKKRKALGKTTLSALSPVKTLAEMQQIDVKILEIRKQFRTEIKNGILQIVERYNVSFLRLAQKKKDEFETMEEFEHRIAKKMAKLNHQQAAEFDGFQARLENAYNQQVAPFIKQLKELSANEFTLTADNLVLKLGTYNGESDTYPVSIRARQPFKGIQVAANANIPIPRQEAREFKLHYQNNILRPEIVGNFQTPKVFMISQAYVIDDATTKKYDLFAARFVDLGNGTLYDPKTKLIWSKEGNTKDISQYNAIAYIKRLNGQAYRGFRDWRLPTLGELRSLVSYAKGAGYGVSGKPIAAYLNREGFSNLQERWYWTSTLKSSSSAWYISFKSGEENSEDDRGFGYHRRVLPVRSGR